MANRYWVGGSGTWDSSTTTNWASSSGGAGGSSAPTNVDSVFFDGNSGSGLVTVPNGMSGICGSFDSTNSSVTFASTTGVIFMNGAGSITMGVSLPLAFQTASSPKTYSPNGFSAGGVLCSSSSFSLLGNSVFTGTVQASSSGTIDTGNYSLESDIVSFGSTTTFTYGSSIVTARQFQFGTGTPTITGTGQFLLIGGGQFQAGTRTYNDIRFNGATTVTGTPTFSNLTIAASTTVTFTAGTTTTISTLTVLGSAGNLSVMQSSSAGSAFTISKSSGTVSIDYASIKDSTATGGATWYAGANSTNVSGNSGWIFTAPPVAPGTITNVSTMTNITSLKL